MSDKIADMGTPVDIPMKELFIDHKFNVRGEIAPITVVDFAKAIERDGLKTPITVRHYSNAAIPQYKYQVVAGHRRSMAFKILKRETIPAFLKTYENELAAKTESFIENLHREDLDIKQEAHGLQPYLDAFWSEGQIADHLGMSKGWVKIRVMLLSLDPKVQDYAAVGLLKQDHIKFLYGKTVTQQLEFVREVKEAEAKNEKLVLEKPEKKQNPHVLHPLSRKEIFDLMSTIYDNGMEMGFWSRCMSCCAGQISIYELMKDFEAWSVENGKPYRVPMSMIAERTKK